MTDTLQVVAENTAVLAAIFADGNHGKVMTNRWIDRGKPVKQDDRTGDDIDRELSEKFGWAHTTTND